MAEPVGIEPEWIELVNNTDVPVYLDSIKIKDATKTIIDLPIISLSPQQYCILVKDTSLFKSTRNLISGITLIQSKIPTLNNTSDELIIYRKDGSVMDSIYYDMKWGARGISLERIDLNLPAFKKENWTASKSADSATAGYINSCNQKVLDLFLNAKMNPSDRANYCLITIFKNGETNHSSVLNILIDKNKDGLFKSDELIESQQLDNLEQINIKKFNSDIFLKHCSKHEWYNVLITIKNSDDHFPNNDSVLFRVFNNLKFNTIIINELLFEPSLNNSEFIELYNSSEDTLLIGGYGLFNKNAIEIGKGVVFPENFNIYPHSFAVAARDTLIFNTFPELKLSKELLIYNSSFNLLSDSDFIVIINPDGTLQDSIVYQSNWHLKDISTTRNVSLEKISPLLNGTDRSSWSSCLDEKRSTPGHENSVSKVLPDTSSKIDVNPNPFSPESASGANYCIITYMPEFKQAQIFARIFTVSGYCLKIFNKIEFPLNKCTLLWDGKNDNGVPLAAGPYILLIESHNLEDSSVETIKKLIVIGY